ARRAEERPHLKPRPRVPSPPRKSIPVEQHVERDVLPVRRRDQRTRARADVDVRLDAELLARLQDTEVREPTRGSPGSHERDLEAAHASFTLSEKRLLGKAFGAQFSWKSSLIR